MARHQDVSFFFFFFNPCGLYEVLSGLFHTGILFFHSRNFPPLASIQAMTPQPFGIVLMWVLKVLWLPSLGIKCNYSRAVTAHGIGSWDFYLPVVATEVAFGEDIKRVGHY